MAEPLIDQLREMAVRGLRRMYRRQERLFVFRLRRGREGIVSEGLSRRYTAIALIGLAEHSEIVPSVLERDDPRDVCARLVGDAPLMENLGDVALTAWASTAVGYPDRQRAWSRLAELRPDVAAHATVDLAWTLSALCQDSESALVHLRDQVARRLIQACDGRSGLFPHWIGRTGGGLHAHVASFADQVYPIQALSWLRPRERTQAGAGRRGAMRPRPVRPPGMRRPVVVALRSAERPGARSDTQCTRSTRTRWGRWPCARWVRRAASTSRRRSTRGWRGSDARRS